MSKRSRHSNPTDSGSTDFPPIHSKGQAFVSPMLTPSEGPHIGGEPEDFFFEGAPDPMNFIPGKEKSRR